MNVAVHRRIWLIAALMALTASAMGNTLTFVPQLYIPSGTTNYSWFEPGNWFIPDDDGNLVPAGRVPQPNDNAVIMVLVDAGTTGVRVQNLLLTNNAVVSNGTSFSVQNLQMLSGSSFQDAQVNILVSLNVGGTNCVLKNSVHLGSRDSWKPLEKIIDGRTVSEVLEEGAHWNPSATEHPSAAHSPERTLDG